MRALFVVIAGAVLAMPSAASAQRPDPICSLVAGPYEYQGALTPLLGGLRNAAGPLTPGGGAQAAARQALGAQYTGMWLDTARQGWSVAFAPGPLDAEAARAAIRARLAEQFNAEQVAFLDAKLHVLPDKYSEAELETVRAQVGAIASASGFNLGYGISCFASGSWRVEVTRYAVKQTPEVVAETEALFAQFGDKVHLSYSESVPTLGGGMVPAPAPPAPGPAPAPAPPKQAAVRVVDYASVPRTSRCVRGKVVVRARKSTGLRAVTLAAGKRRSSARPGGTARLKLKSRRTRVTVTVRMNDGRTATQTLTYRRCR